MYIAQERGSQGAEPPSKEKHLTTQQNSTFRASMFGRTLHSTSDQNITNCAERCPVSTLGRTAKHEFLRKNCNAWTSLRIHFLDELREKSLAPGVILVSGLVGPLTAVPQVKLNQLIIDSCRLKMTRSTGRYDVTVQLNVGNKGSKTIYCELKFIQHKLQKTDANNFPDLNSNLE